MEEKENKDKSDKRKRENKKEGCSSRGGQTNLAHIPCR